MKSVSHLLGHFVCQSQRSLWGPNLVGHLVGHMVIKLVVHLVSQSLWYLWWYKVGCPFGGPSGLEVRRSFGVPKLVVPSWWAILWTILCAKVGGPVDGLKLMVYLLGHPVMKSVVHYVEYLVTKLVAPFVVHSWWSICWTTWSSSQ